jgi:hypothetical protein
MVDNAGDTINALIDAVEAIERELGITPSGVYSDVRVRMDILEARINNPLAPAPNVENPFIIGNDGVTISTGDGYPTENRLPGSLYLRKDGYGAEGLYARRPDGYWHQIDTDPWTAAGDLAGNIYSQTVIGLQGRPVSSAAPTNTPAGDGYVLSWNGSQWAPQVGFYAAGDLTGTKINQKVVSIDGYHISMVNLNSTKDGYSLIWNNSATQWEAQRLAVVFDPLNSGTTTNIRSNRYLTQSPIDNTKTGIVNLSSDSVQLTAGATANYAAIVGGDQNTVTGDYGFIGDGYSNTIDAVISAIVGGDHNHIISGSDLSFIGGGRANAISGDRSVIVGGDTNVIVGSQSAILGGVGNAVNGARSVILLGNTNVIDTNDSIIGNGLNNLISLGSYNTILNGNIGQIVSGSYSTLINGLNNIITGDYSFISAGHHNAITGNQSSVLNGNNNSIIGSNSTLLNGSLNLVTASGAIILGGVSNIVSSDRVSIFGDSNTVISSSDLSVIFGASNTVSDGYSFVQGLLNLTSVGSTYTSLFGNNNSVGGSTHVSIWGTNNTVHDSAPYSFIFGNLNTINNNSSYSHVDGYSNTINANSTHSSAHGSNNSVTGNLSNVWGSNNTITANSSTVCGSNNTATANSSVILGNYGKTIYPGQLSIAARAINGTTAGSSQYSKIILDGYQAAGGQFDLKIPGSGANIALEDGKSYDMTVRVLINNTTGSPACARYVLDVLAHCESGTLVLDAINTTIGNAGPGWTVSLSTSTNQLVVTVNSFGGDSRRAIATIDWQEITRL